MWVGVCVTRVTVRGACGISGLLGLSTLSPDGVPLASAQCWLLEMPGGIPTFSPGKCSLGAGARTLFLAGVKDS